MNTSYHFDSVKTQEEFLVIFQGLCNIAESAFNQFDTQFKNPGAGDAAAVCKNVSYLMSITFVIMGMRGDYAGFREGNFLTAFHVQVNGVDYDQSYLYRMNDYFANRFNQALEVLEKVDPESHKSYKTVWGNF